MDLLDFAATDDVTLELKKPGSDQPAVDEDGVAIVITFYNIDTPQYIRARNAFINQSRKLAQRGKLPTVEQELELGIDFLAAITKGWNRMPAFKEKLDFNTKNAKRVYGTIHWLRAQVDDRVTQAGLRVSLPTEGQPEP